jgi:hypothetical protein
MHVGCDDDNGEKICLHLEFCHAGQDASKGVPRAGDRGEGEIHAVQLPEPNGDRSRSSSSRFAVECRDRGCPDGRGPTSSNANINRLCPGSQVTR